MRWHISQAREDNIQFSTAVTPQVGEAWLGIACTNTYATAIASMLWEMEGIIKTLDIALVVGIQHLIVSSDAKDLVDSFQSSQFDPKPQLVDMFSQTMSICIIERSLYT